MWPQGTVILARTAVPALFILSSFHCLRFPTVQAIGLPAGVLNVVNGAGPVGQVLAEHPLVDKLSFTGSVPTGSKVMGTAAAGASLARLTAPLCD